MDAWYHFFEEGRTIDQVALKQCIRLTILINLTHAVKNGRIEVKHLRWRNFKNSARWRLIPAGRADGDSRSISVIALYLLYRLPGF